MNRADYEAILRVPGIGVKSATLIIEARRFRRLNSEHLKKIGVVMKRARYFITCAELTSRCVADLTPGYVRRTLTSAAPPAQLTLNFAP